MKRRKRLLVRRASSFYGDKRRDCYSQHTPGLNKRFLCLGSNGEASQYEDDPIVSVSLFHSLDIQR